MGRGSAAGNASQPGRVCHCACAGLRRRRELFQRKLSLWRGDGRYPATAAAVRAQLGALPPRQGGARGGGGAAVRHTDRATQIIQSDICLSGR